MSKKIVIGLIAVVIIELAAITALTTSEILAQ